jgi:hypothetical protein
LIDEVRMDLGSDSTVCQILIILKERNDIAAEMRLKSDFVANWKGIEGRSNRVSQLEWMKKLRILKKMEM